MNQSSTFQREFFTYALPIPCCSHYSKEEAKSNDLRLLVEIATKSYLRMYTDSKTSNLHFTCKLKGSECLDIEAELDHKANRYFFILDCQKQNHKWNCEMHGVAFKYLQIYNLFKLKKDLIEKFMKDNHLLEESPSLILSRLSDQSEEYFFEKYIKGQIELRRKLRKRFDNVVNIDIKKIGKPEEKELPISLPNKNKQQNDQEGYIELHHRSIQKTPQLQAQELNSGEKDLGAKLTNSLLKNKKKNIQKKGKRKSKRIKIKRSVKKVMHADINISDARQSIFILGEDLQSKGQEIFIDSKVEEELPELKVLNEQAQYLWSSSDSSSEEQKREFFDIIEINREDYFKSLRNSTLKKSLQKQSLSQILFPNMKQNCT